jgi:predicted acyl esterase
MPAVLASNARRTGAAVALLALIAACFIGMPATAAPVPSGWTYTDHWFTSHDGIQMHAGVFLPADRAADEKHPVLMNIGPYTAPNGGAAGGNLEGIIDRNPELFTHPGMRQGRYAYLQVDARGFGGSEGCFEYYMANEAKDAKAAIEWAASQPWSTGKVGMWGKSYDGAQQVLALASQPKGLAATVIQAPGLSAYTALWHNGVHYATGRYGTTGVYTADDIFVPQNLDTIGSPEYARAAASPVTSIPGNPTCRTDALVGMNVIADRKDPFWQTKEPYKGAAGSSVPTFWVHGFFDANTKATHTDIWSSLTGPKKAWFGQWDHIRGHEAGVGRSKFFLDEAFRFLDLHVRGVQPAVNEHQVTVQSGNAPQRWRNEAQWPPADARTWRLPLRTGTYKDAPGNEATGAGPGAGIWSITPALPHDAHLAGEAALTLSVESLVPNTHTVAHLYDIAPNGTAAVVTRGAIATAAMGAEERKFTLYPQDWVFEAGHRIAVRVSGGDDTWYSPGVSNTDVTVKSGALDLPLLRYRRDQFIPGGASKNQGTRTLAADMIQGATVTSEPPPAQEPAPAQ